MDQKEYEKMNNFNNSHWYFKGKKEIIKKVISDSVSRNGITILDIGCGSGYFFDEYDGDGIEPCEMFVGEKIINKPIEKVELDKKYDVIIALDVLEHLEDDSIIKKFIENNLNDNGVCIITVPAHRKLFGEHDRANHHYRRYDKKDLVDLFSEYNYKVTYINSILYPVEYIVRSFNKNKKSDLKMPNKLINYILYKIFAFEKNTYKWNWNGLSLLMVITKK